MADIRTERLDGNRTVQVLYEEARGTIGRGDKPCSLDDVLQKVFRKEYGKTIERYLKDYPADLARAIGDRDARDFKLIRTGEPVIRSSWRQCVYHLPIDIDIPAVIEASVSQESLRASGLYAVRTVRKQFTIPFYIRCFLDLIERKCSPEFVAPAAVRGTVEPAVPPDADGYLLPILHEQDYQAIARSMLEQYCPEALEKAAAVNGWELAKRMNVKVQMVWFPREDTDLGRIYFQEGQARFHYGNAIIETHQVPGISILINRTLCNTEDLVNSTLIHECCHLYLHRLFFTLQILAEQPYQSYTGRKAGGEDREYDISDPAERMEWQAEKMAAHVLMEENITRNEIERMLHSAGRGGVRTPERMKQIVRELARIFDVSIGMAKRRAAELGYPEAEGVYNLVNSQWMPDHGCRGPWKPEITYTVSRMEAVRMLAEDPAFARAMGSGLYVYVEGHFCLDRPEYIHRDRDGRARLSAYARRYVNECCLSFQIRSRMTTVQYSTGQAARGNPVTGVLQTRHALDAEPESREREAQNSRYCADARIWNDIKQQMPDDIKGAVCYLMKRKGLTQEEISMRLGVSRPAFASWFRKNISLRHIVAICIAMDVRFDISQELIRLGRHTILNSEEDAILKSFLFETKDLTVARANEILRAQGMKPLTEGWSEELAEVI